MSKGNRRSMPKKSRAAVVERSQGMCEANCGRPANEVHHRRFLSRGGKHNVANLVALCNPGGGGNGGNGCHARAHSGVAPDGWAISAWERRTEAEVPFVDVHGVTWFFDDYGNKEKTTLRNCKHEALLRR